MSQYIYVLSVVAFFLSIIFCNTISGLDHVVRDDD